jgi:hypothetical protein
MREPFRDSVPIRSVVQVDSDPAALPDIRRPKVPIGRTGQEKVLRDVGGLAPHRVTPGAMVIGRVRERREHLPADPERRFTVRHLLPGARERQAQSPQPREWVRHRSRRNRRQVREDAQPPFFDSLKFITLSGIVRQCVRIHAVDGATRAAAASCKNVTL